MKKSLLALALALLATGCAHYDSSTEFVSADKSRDIYKDRATCDRKAQNLDPLCLVVRCSPPSPERLEQIKAEYSSCMQDLGYTAVAR